MKKKPLKRRWPYFFGQRGHGSAPSGAGNMPALIKSEAKWSRAEDVLAEILRWADDGGKMLDPVNPATGSGLDAALERGHQSESLQKRQRSGNDSGNEDSTPDGS